jgi:predicted ABC-type ATPase
LANPRQLIVVAGPNGSGKTTFAQEYLSQHPAAYLSADAIAAEISPDAPESARFAAGRRFLTELAARLAADESVLVESTLSGHRFRRFLEEARTSGFATTIVMLFLDSADTCVARVRERVRRGGHDVPESDVRRRFLRSLRNFWQSYRFLTDDWLLIYNAGSDFQDVAIGAGQSVSVHDEGVFSQFLSMLHQRQP